MTTSSVLDEQRFIVLRRSPDQSQKRLATITVLAMVLALVMIVGPLSSLPVGRIDAFIPAYATAMVVNDLITTFLLFAQVAILRSGPLLVVANAYLFTALVTVPWALTFPGMFAPHGLLGAGLQSTPWIYILWHAGFSLFVIGYAIVKRDYPARQLAQGAVYRAISGSVAITVTVVALATYAITRGDALLPRLFSDTVHLTPVWTIAGSALMLLGATALPVLQRSPRSLLDLWLTLVMTAFLIEVFLITFYGARFTLGWYIGRLFGVLSGSIVLIVLLHEITTMYVDLLRAVRAQGREREARLMTGEVVAAAVAHDVTEPLREMIRNARSGIAWLDRVTPCADEAKEAFSEIASCGHRAASVIDSIRAMFKKSNDDHWSFDVEELVRETLSLAAANLERHRIVVHTQMQAQLPLVSGDRMQIQQVLLNLITNGIVAMSANDEFRVLDVICTLHSDGNIVISVADTGVGVDERDVDRLFTPMFSSKNRGGRTGLFISRSIIEAHRGKIWVSPNKGRGAVFQFTLRPASVELVRMGNLEPA